MSAYQSPSKSAPNSGTSGLSTEESARANGDAETVRDLAQAITDGNAFTDADAVRVARAYLDGCGETA